MPESIPPVPLVPTLARIFDASALPNMPLAMRLLVEQRMVVCFANVRETSTRSKYVEELQDTQTCTNTYIYTYTYTNNSIYISINI